MSSNRRARVARIVLIISTAALAAACASAPKPVGDSPRAGRLPTEQYSATVTSHPDQILLAPHAEGLSPPQLSALSELVGRWRDTGNGPIEIQAPSHGGGEAYRAATIIQAELMALGVGEERIVVAGYDGDDKPGEPIVVGFDHYVAKGPDCGRNWDNFTSTITNGPDSNFGCAVTANVAAQIANPADLAGAQPQSPGDSARREVVLGKYRQGQPTSSAKDDQADGTVSASGH